jgi:hypothetical protein
MLLEVTLLAVAAVAVAATAVVKVAVLAVAMAMAKRNLIRQVELATQDMVAVAVAAAQEVVALLMSLTGLLVDIAGLALLVGDTFFLALVAVVDRTLALVAVAVVAVVVQAIILTVLAVAVAGVHLEVFLKQAMVLAAKPYNLMVKATHSAIVERLTERHHD